MPHDRIHAREPTHHVDRWTRGTIRTLEDRDGHCVVTVEPENGGDRDVVELVVTLAVRDLFLGRLDIGDDGSPIGETVWFRKRGGT